MFDSLTDSLLKELGEAKAGLLKVQEERKQLSEDVDTSRTTQIAFITKQNSEREELVRQFNQQKSDLFKDLETLSRSINDPGVRDSFIAAMQGFAKLTPDQQGDLTNLTDLKNDLNNLKSTFEAQQKERGQLIQAWRDTANALDGWYERQNTTSEPLSRYARQADNANFYFIALQRKLGNDQETAENEYLGIAESARK